MMAIVQQPAAAAGDSAAAAAAAGDSAAAAAAAGDSAAAAAAGDSAAGRTEQLADNVCEQD